MKIIKIFLGLMAIGCGGTINPTDCTQVIILFDNTGNSPNCVFGEDIEHLLNLNSVPYHGVNVEISTISNVDINRAEFISLPTESPYQTNPEMRKSKIRKFRTSLNSQLKTFCAHDTIEHSKSKIYSQLVAQANRLSKIKGKSKYLVIASDLQENSEINFYLQETQFLLAKNPKLLREKLSSDLKFGNLTGINVWFVHQPKTFETNQSYIKAARFYREWLMEKGAEVHIGIINPSQ